MITSLSPTGRELNAAKYMVAFYNAQKVSLLELIGLTTESSYGVPVSVTTKKCLKELRLGLGYNSECV